MVLWSAVVADYRNPADHYSLLGGQYAPAGPHFPTVTPLNPCLVSGWPMNEGSGLTFNDVSGNVNTATVPSTPTWQANAGFPGITPLWGGGAGATSTSTTLVNFARTQPFSVSVWMATTGTGAQTFLGNLQGANFTGWELGTGISHTKTDFFFSSNANTSNFIRVQGSTTINTGARFYVVATYDGSSAAAGVKLYVNGALETNTVVTNGLTSAVSSTAPAKIGASVSGNAFFGPMAFAEVYNCVLTPTQVSTYNAAGPGIY